MIPDSEDTQRRRVFSKYQNQSKGLVADEESSRVLFCEQRIFASIFPRHCSQTWGETLYFYCICETVHFYCICETLHFYCICVVRWTWNDLYYIGPLSLKKDFCLNVNKGNLGHNRSFVCLIQCKLFELRYKSSLCVWGALYLWTRFLDQNGICTRTRCLGSDGLKCTDLSGNPDTDLVLRVWGIRPVVKVVGSVNKCSILKYAESGIGNAPNWQKDRSSLMKKLWSALSAICKCTLKRPKWVHQ